MARPIARSIDEAHLYLSLQPCQRCGTNGGAWQDGYADDEGAPARRYLADCPGCGERRGDIFRLPEKAGEPRPDDPWFFGGHEPSQLFDAGEWSMLASTALKDGAAPPGPEASGGGRMRSFALVVAAFEEMLKFIPAGFDEVPESAFWTGRGQAVRREKPHCFTRDYLTSRRLAFQAELDDRFAR